MTLIKENQTGNSYNLKLIFVRLNRFLTIGKRENLINAA